MPALASMFSPADSSAPVNGYTVSNLTWNFTPDESGAQPVNITGSLEDVLDYLNSTYQNYPFPTITPFDESTNGTARSDLIDRGDNSDLCYIFPVANAEVINKGSQYLSSLQGSGANGPGPGACGKVSCSYNSAIWWCNDNDQTLTVAYADMGALAYHVLAHCYDSRNHFGMISGQTFHDAGWNVIVRSDDQC